MKVQQLDGDIANIRQQGLAMGIPPAREPLEGAKLNTLATMIQRAEKSMSGGELKLPPIARVSGQVEAVPPDLASRLLSMQQFVEQFSGRIPGLESYQFDAVASMSTNNGIDDAAAVIDGLGSDQALLEAFREAATAAPPAEEEPAEDEPAMDEQTEEE